MLHQGRSHEFGPHFKSPQMGGWLPLVAQGQLVEFALGRVHLLAGRLDEHTCRNRLAASESDGMMLQIDSTKQEHHVYMINSMNVMRDLHSYIHLLQCMISRD